MTPIDLFKALADTTRLSTLNLILKEGELCVCELTEALDLPQPKMSKHLARLRNDGFLVTRRKDQWVYYRLADTLPDWVTDILKTSAEAQQNQLAQALDRLQNMSCRPVCC